MMPVWRTGPSALFPTLLRSALCCPEKLSLQGLGIYRRPVELCLVSPVLVHSRVDVVAERSVQIVVSRPLLQLNVQFEFLHPLSQPFGLLLSLRRTPLQLREI